MFYFFSEQTQLPVRRTKPVRILCNEQDIFVRDDDMDEDEQNAYRCFQQVLARPYVLSFRQHVDQEGILTHAVRVA